MKEALTGWIVMVSLPTLSLAMHRHNSDQQLAAGLVDPMLSGVLSWLPFYTSLRGLGSLGFLFLRGPVSLRWKEYAEISPRDLLRSIDLSSSQHSSDMKRRSISSSSSCTRSQRYCFTSLSLSLRESYWSLIVSLDAK
jgi:hypothetical protein